MFSSFFKDKKWALWAYGGAIFIILLLVYQTHLNVRINEWYKNFYDNVQNSKDHKVDDLVKVKKEFHVPLELSSCHTAIVDGYVIEGHVPADEVKRLLELKPKDAVGIAVPGMPMESQGMEQGGKAEQYDVILFKKDGSQEVFATYIGSKKLK